MLKKGLMEKFDYSIAKESIKFESFKEIKSGFVLNSKVVSL
jgi:hypothetical protein